MVDRGAESEDLELEHRFGLLDGAHYAGHLHIKKSREEEVKMKEHLNTTLRKLKRIAQIFLAFSLCIILNDCVGLSS